MLVVCACAVGALVADQQSRRYSLYEALNQHQPSLAVPTGSGADSIHSVASVPVLRTVKGSHSGNNVVPDASRAAASAGVISKTQHPPNSTADEISLYHADLLCNLRAKSSDDARLLQQQPAENVARPTAPLANVGSAAWWSPTAGNDRLEGGSADSTRLMRVVSNSIDYQQLTDSCMESSALGLGSPVRDKDNHSSYSLAALPPTGGSDRIAGLGTPSAHGGVHEGPSGVSCTTSSSMSSASSGVSSGEPPFVSIHSEPGNCQLFAVPHHVYAPPLASCGLTSSDNSSAAAAAAAAAAALLANSGVGQQATRTDCIGDDDKRFVGLCIQ